MVRAIIYKRRKLGTGLAGQSKFFKKGSNDSSRRSHKNPDEHLKKCRPASVKVNVHYSTIRKTLQKMGAMGELQDTKH